jgi:hypothetical protein
VDELESANHELRDSVRRSEHRLRVGALLAVALTASVALLGWAQAGQTLTAAKFDLDNGSGSLRQFDNGMPALWISNPNKPHHVIVQTYPNGETTVGVHVGLDGPPRAAMGVLPDGTAYINLRDQNGNVTWSAP